jgi:hypothetical protein
MVISPYSTVRSVEPVVARSSRARCASAAGDVRTDCVDHADALDTGGERKLLRVETRPVVDVDEFTPTARCRMPSSPGPG